MKSLITGGAGFIGYHLARRLLDRGDVVTLVDSLDRGRVDQDLERVLAHDRAHLVRADLLQPGALKALGEGWDEVYHLAAVVGVRHVLGHPSRVLRVNVGATQAVIDWVCDVRPSRFFFASTSEAYAWTMRFHDLPVPTPEDVPLAVDTPENPRATYALSKIVGEAMTHHACNEAGVPFAIGRFHNVYGPRMGLAHVIPELFARYRSGDRPLRVFTPEATRAFCFVDDAIEAVLRIMEKPSNRVYNIGNDLEEISIGDLAALMLRTVGAEDVALEPAFLDGPAVPRRCPDIGRLREDVGFVPAVSLAEGLRRTLAWYRDMLDRAPDSSAV